MLKKHQWISFLILFFFATTCLALPFTIVPTPGTTLPTLVQAGQSATAYYSITNNANRSLNNNYIKYLPPNVSQVLADNTVPNLCGATFNFTAYGTPLDTCVLELNVTGSVNGNDPDPHHHLFACLYGGVLCAGTLYGLNVTSVGTLGSLTITPASPTIDIGQTQQFTATATFSDGTTVDVTSLSTWSSSNTSVATVNSTGLATAVSAGTSVITVTFQGVSANTTLTVDNLAEATGTYTTTGSATVPIVVQSANQGTSWAYTVNSSTSSVLPTGSSDFSVVAASCSGPVCLNVGSYFLASTAQIYGFQTTNSGTSWATSISATSSAIPPSYVEGELTSSSCTNSGNLCIAVGEYTNAHPGPSFPYVALSTNGGGSYSAAVFDGTPALPSDFGTNGELWSAICTSTICIASGEYEDNGGDGHPLLVQSTNNGGTWSYTITSTTPTPPTDISTPAILSATACNSSNCIAAGSYTSSNFPTFDQVPLAYQGTSTGTGWSVIVSSSNVPGDYSSGINTNLSGAACSSTACFAVGEYDSTGLGDTQPAPVIYTSVGGAAPTIVVSSSTPTLPSNISAQLVQASCSSALCVADGSYQATSSGVILPFLLVSTNGGSTWSVASLPAAPSDLTTTSGQGVTMGGVNCQGAFCVVSGSYLNTSAVSQPLVLESTNSGLAWTYAVTSSTPAVPSDTASIALTNVSLSSLAARLNEKTHKNFQSPQKEINKMLTVPHI